MTNYPFYVVLAVKASLAEAANNYLRRQGWGPGNVVRAIIRKDDPDEADPVAYATMLRCTPAMRTALHRRAKAAGSDARIYWTTDRRDAIQTARAKLDQWGYRLKPNG